MRRNIISLFLLSILLMGAPLMSAQASSVLPASVQIHFQTPLEKAGNGTYRKFGFRIYDATLWAPNGTWDPDKPFALELHYKRSLSKDTVIDSVTDDIRDQNVADDATLAEWNKILDRSLPAIEDGDTLIGIMVPGQKSQLFYNGKKIAELEDATFSKAFFNIWLGDNADEDLRNDLLGKK